MSGAAWGSGDHLGILLENLCRCEDCARDKFRNGGGCRVCNWARQGENRKGTLGRFVGGEEGSCCRVETVSEVVLFGTIRTDRHEGTVTIMTLPTPW